MIRIKHLLFLCLFSFLFTTISAQKILQMEKRGSFKTWRYYIGDQLTFEVDGQWYTRIIRDLNLEKKIIQFEDGFVEMEKIDRIETEGGEAFGKAASISLWVFGASWIFFSVADWAVGGSLTLLSAIVPGSAFTLGGLIRLIFKPKKHRLGKRKRLRMLDLTIVPGDQGT
jgi:hypothetical protein